MICSPKKPLENGQGLMSEERRSLISMNAIPFPYTKIRPITSSTLSYYAVDPFGYVYEQDYLTGEYRGIARQSIYAGSAYHGISKGSQTILKLLSIFLSLFPTESGLPDPVGFFF